MTLSLRFAARSEIGLVRRNNEDSGYASNDLLVVADGMGGHEAGELASAATVAAIVGAAETSVEVEALMELLANAVITSGEYIADVVSANRNLAGMGTTMTALALREDRIAVAHVGDSRAYLLRDDELQQMTKDHTFVQSLVDRGEITREQAAVHPRRNLMMRAIDGIHPVDVDLSVREARAGDRFMLCSDGVCGVISDDLIEELLETEDLTIAVTNIIDAVLDAGAPDNITLIVADVIDAEVSTDSVVIGAAADKGNHKRLPGIGFPEEAQFIVSAKPEIVNRRGWVMPALMTAASVLLGIAGGFWWLSNQWFVGALNGSEYIGVYQGVPVAGLNRLVDPSTIKLVNLPEFERAQVDQTLEVQTHADGLAALDRLQARVATCIALPTTAGCPVISP
jgi:protein phosphatase